MEDPRVIVVEIKTITRIGRRVKGPRKFWNVIAVGAALPKYLDVNIC